MSLPGEIKRRKILQVAAAYAVVAWVVIQIVDVIIDPLGLPEWLDTVVILVFVVGFPIAMILAWVFDITPEGIKRTIPWIVNEPLMPRCYLVGAGISRKLGRGWKQMLAPR